MLFLLHKIFSLNILLFLDMDNFAFPNVSTVLLPITCCVEFNFNSLPEISKFHNYSICNESIHLNLTIFPSTVYVQMHVLCGLQNPFWLGHFCSKFVRSIPSTKCQPTTRPILAQSVKSICLWLICGSQTLCFIHRGKHIEKIYRCVPRDNLSWTDVYYPDRSLILTFFWIHILLCHYQRKSHVEVM